MALQPPGRGALDPRHGGARQNNASEIAYNAYVTRGAEPGFKVTYIPNYSSAGIPMHMVPGQGGDPLRTIIDRFRGNLGQLQEDQSAHITLWETLTHHRVGDGKGN